MCIARGYQGLYTEILLSLAGNKSVINYVTLLYHKLNTSTQVVTLALVTYVVSS